MTRPTTTRTADHTQAAMLLISRWVLLTRLALGAAGLFVAAASHAGPGHEHHGQVLQHCLASAARSGELEALNLTEVRSSMAAPRLPVPKHIQEILTRVVKVARVPATAIKLIVVDGGSSAWISSSGELFVSARLLDGLLEPEEIAGVLAHEIAHFENSDSRRKLCDMVAMAGDVDLPHADARTKVYRAIWAGDRELAIRMFQNNHARELRADLRAADMLQAMGIPPKVMLLALMKSTPKGAGDFSATHPALEVRLENLAAHQH